MCLMSHLPPELARCTCSQESSTGGGMAVVTVDVLMSPMMLSASRRAWYIRSISSRCWACSWDSSISEFWSPHEYSWASRSALMYSFVWTQRERREEKRGSFDLWDLCLQLNTTITLLSTTPGTDIVYHEVHDGLGHQVADGLVDDGHVGVHQVPNGLHLPLQLRIHAVHEVVTAAVVPAFTLQRQSQRGLKESCKPHSLLYFKNILYSCFVCPIKCCGKDSVMMKRHKHTFPSLSYTVKHTNTWDTNIQITFVCMVLTKWGLRMCFNCSCSFGEHTFVSTCD